MPDQAANLATWGYPHVMGALRFHITLTGRLGRAALDATEAALAPVLTPLLPVPFDVDEIAPVGEGGDGRFRLLRRFALTG